MSGWTQQFLALLWLLLHWFQVFYWPDALPNKGKFPFNPGSERDLLESRKALRFPKILKGT
jgi:hypothetical protein